MIKKVYGERKFGGKKPAGKFGDKRRGGSEGKFPGSDRGGRFFQKKVCRFCTEKTVEVDYRDVEKIKRFLTEKGKIIPRRITGNCAKCQRKLTRAVKKARHSALVAFQID